MSDPKLLEICENARILGLARWSLLLVSMPWLMAGCLVPDPEKFPEPRSTAPVLNADRAAPSVTQIIRPKAPAFRESFSVPYQSQDEVGDFPVAYLYMDFRTPAQQLLTSDTLANDLDKTFRIEFSFANFPCEVADPTNEACCHQLTLLATHRSKLVNDGGIEVPDPIAAKDDLAMLVWWLALSPPGPPANPQAALIGCPTSAPTSSP
jgi:hypothetical protein